MRLKPLPSPPSAFETVDRARRAVPLVPGDEMDCCARLLDRLDIEEREEARRWLTLLRALGLVEAGADGYSRTRREPTRADAAEAFLSNVYGAREALAALDDTRERAADDVFERIEGIVPEWERDKHRGQWREVWRERTADLLGWLDLLDLADRGENGYVLGDRARDVDR